MGTVGGARALQQLLQNGGVGLALRGIEAILANFQPETFTCDWVQYFGNAGDGVIECINKGAAKGYFETGYYTGSHPKPIVNVSTQIGCPAACHFCELGAEERIGCQATESYHLRNPAQSAYGRANWIRTPFVKAKLISDFT